MDKKRDQELSTMLSRGQDGDKDAYEKFLACAAEVLRGYISRRVRDMTFAEDILQDTLISIHRARHTYSPEKPVGPWLYAICEHRTLDFFRRYRRIEKIEVHAPSELENFAFPLAEGTERSDGVYEALNRLPEKQRQVIELLKVQDLSVKDIAARIGMSESAVKVTAFRGYEAIRRFLGVRQK